MSAVSRRKIQPKLRHRSHLSTTIFILYEESWQKLSCLIEPAFQTGRLCCKNGCLVSMMVDCPDPDFHRRSPVAETDLFKWRRYESEIILIFDFPNLS